MGASFRGIFVLDMCVETRWWVVDFDSADLPASTTVPWRLSNLHAAQVGNVAREKCFF